MLQFLDQGKQLVHQLILGDLFDDLPPLEQQALPHAACDAAIGGAGLAGAGYGLFASVRWVAGLAETWKGRRMLTWPSWRKR